MQKKDSTRLCKTDSGSNHRASGNGTRPRSNSKSDRDESIKATDERMLRLWKKIYEDHHPVKKARTK